MIDISRLVVFGDSLSDNGNLFKLTGSPQPPYWNGHFSNGPTYAEQLAQWLGVPLDDLAFGGAEATPPLAVPPALPINLSDQVAAYITQPHGQPAAKDTALIFIGTNDYLSLLNDLPKVTNDVASIESAIADLTTIGALNLLSNLPRVANDLASIERAGQDLATTGLLSDLPQNIQTLVADAVPIIESTIHDLTTGEISNLLSDLPKVTGVLASIESAIGDLTPAGIQNLISDLKVTDVVASINQAIGELTNAGVQKIILFTLPDLGQTPAAENSGAAQLAHELAVANNAALMQMAASHPNVQVVDVFQLSETVFADPHSFGLTADLNVTWLDLLAAGSTQFAPNEVGFFDDIHPTFAASGIVAAFADAVLTSDHVQFLDGTHSVIQAQLGDNFIFATPINPTTPGLNDNYTIYGGSGNDVIFAGSGNVTVHGGSGTELIAAGSGNANLYGGGGTDVLATNSTGTNVLVGGQGDNALIVNRAGTNTLTGGSGNELIVLKENASLFNLNNGTFNFGAQDIVGNGHDTLQFIINDQNPSVEQALINEFRMVDSAFRASMSNNPGTFKVDGLNVTGIDSIELQVDSVSKNPSTPYLITYNTWADGPAASVSHTLTGLLQTAEHWGLLTV
jgi:phospholipase/lecithinase/hemolysin